MSDLYERLRYRFDTMGSGFPKTGSGSEIQLLKMIYSEEEARLFLDMTQDPETVRQAANRLVRDENTLGDALEAMALKGLLFRERKEGKAFYSAPPFVVGVLEFQINRLLKEPELSAAVGMYGIEGFLKSLTDVDDPHQRTIPINREIVSKWPIATYDDALAILDQHQTIGVTACTCRVMSKQLGAHLCGNAIETCIGFDAMAEYYIENGFGRKISRDEAVSIITKSDEEGMVLQPFNGKDIGVICSCCGDCCAMLLSLKMHPSPAEAVKSSYFAAINPEGCVGCGLCVDRCQIDAIRMNEDDMAIIDLNRCIGCGLCVTTCPTDAACLMKKP